MLVQGMLLQEVRVWPPPRPLLGFEGGLRALLGRGELSFLALLPGGLKDGVLLLLRGTLEWNPGKHFIVAILRVDGLIPFGGRAQRWIFIDRLRDWRRIGNL